MSDKPKPDDVDDDQRCRLRGSAVAVICDAPPTAISDQVLALPESAP